MTVGSALRMSPGFGWILAFSAVFSRGANSLRSVLNQIWKGRGKGRERREKGDGREMECVILYEYDEMKFIQIKTRRV